ncbi:MAG: CDP-alcohol phosphatidyltransferase family protein [Nannocystaceae bacterium]|nr:CDP-alcohol phosphatidyltransferase family protein [Nannocystaceae bacterium]
MSLGDKPRSTVSFLADRANLVTLAGLLCGVSSIYFSAQAALTAATLTLIWALFCDWIDGPIARRSQGRTEVDSAFGGQLDSLADLVCSGVAPGMLLLAVGDFNPWFLPGAFVLAIAGAIRLAHFNTIDGGGDSYSGLPIDSNIIAVTALFVFRDTIGPGSFPAVLYALIVTLAILNVSPFRVPKPTVRSYYMITAYVIGITALNVRLLLTSGPQ